MATTTIAELSGSSTVSTAVATITQAIEVTKNPNNETVAVIAQNILDKVISFIQAEDSCKWTPKGLPRNKYKRAEAIPMQCLQNVRGRISTAPDVHEAFTFAEGGLAAGSKAVTDAEIAGFAAEGATLSAGAGSFILGVLLINAVREDLAAGRSARTLYTFSEDYVDAVAEVDVAPKVESPGINAAPKIQQPEALQPGGPYGNSSTPTPSNETQKECAINFDYASVSVLF